MRTLLLTILLTTPSIASSKAINGGGDIGYSIKIKGGGDIGGYKTGTLGGGDIGFQISINGGGENS